MPCNFNNACSRARSRRGSARPAARRWSSTRSRSPTASRWGRPGMRASLVSRELIADSIELVASAHAFDALVCISGCDKTIPGTVMALARLDVPGLMLYGGSIRPGRCKGHDVTIQQVFEAVGALAAGKISEQELHELEEAASPGRRRLRRPVHRQHDGDGVRGARISPAGSSMVPAEDGAQARGRATRCGELVMDVLRRGQRPQEVITKPGARERDRRRSRRAAARRTPCCTCSRSRTRWGSRSSIDDFDASASARRCCATCSRAVSYAATTSTRRAASRSSPKRLVEAGLLHADAVTVTGRTIGEHADEAEETPGQGVVRPLDDPLKATGGFAILRGNVSPDGCVVKLAGHERRRHVGPARVFDGEEAAMAAVTRRGRAGRRGRDPQRGPGRRPRHARDARRHRGDLGRGAGGERRAHHRRPLLRRHARLHGRPRRARGGARRPDRRAARRRRDHDRRRRAAASTSRSRTSSSPRA